MKDERDRIWAAVVALYKQNEPWWLSRKEEKIADAIAQDYRNSDPWEDAIANYVDSKDSVTASEILHECLKLDIDKCSRAAEMRVTKILRCLNWGNKRKNIQGHKRTIWTRANNRKFDKKVSPGWSKFENADCASFSDGTTFDGVGPVSEIHSIHPINNGTASSNWTDL